MSVDRARLWMRKAENDLLAADNNLASRHIPCDVVCFHCQQAAEKLLKGLLLSLGAQPLRTHDLLALLEEARGLTSIPVPMQSLLPSQKASVGLGRRDCVGPDRLSATLSLWFPLSPTSESHDA